jgi:5-methylcytosine-specific restriction endonuclease McrA
MTIERKCEHCGAVFVVIPSRLKHGRGKHCSPACQYAAIRARPKKVVARACLACGSNFSLEQSKLRRKGAGKYCSRECRDAHWVGSNTPNWQNGAGVYKRGPRWYAIRRRILKRDKVCQHCGTNIKLHVHHQIPFRMFDDPAYANADWNLVVLCDQCHRIEDALFKWVKLPESGLLRFSASGLAWEMVREKGMI